MPRPHRIHPDDLMRVGLLDEAVLVLMLILTLGLLVEFLLVMP